MSHSSTLAASLLAFFFSITVAFAQKPVASGYYVGEGNGVSHGENTYLLLKEFVPLSEESEKERGEKGMMTYLDLPLGVKGAMLSGDGFKTVLVCLDGKGKTLWRKEVGGSHASAPAGIAVDPSGNVYVGGHEGNGLVVRKFDQSGKEIWQSAVDSLETVHRIFSDTGSYVSVLASRTLTYQEKVADTRDGEQIELRSANLYHTLHINRETGKVESDDYNVQLTNACAGGFSEPEMNEHWVNYIHKDDTLLLYINFRDELLMVGENELKGFPVQKVAGSAGQAFVLAGGVAQPYRLFLDRFRPDEKLQKNVEVLLDKGYPDIFMSENELNGVTIFFSDDAKIEVVKFDKELNLLWKKKFDMKKLGAERVMAVVRRENAGYGVGLISLEADGKHRQVKFLSLSGEGEVGK